MLQPSTLKFLKDLKKNNNKPWFDLHRPQYEASKKDLGDFIQSIILQHGKKDNDIRELTPQKCMFRINRDIRFSKDKSPYKTNMGASLDRGGKKSIFAGYYIHIEPGKSFVGGGLWMPMPGEMKKVRQEIDYCGAELMEILNTKKFKAVYGDLYKGEDIALSKVPQGFDKNSPVAGYIKLKSWLAMKEVADKEIISRDFFKNTITAFETLQPLIKFINRALED